MDEVSASGGRKLVDSYYREATRKPHSFLYIRRDQSEPQFLERFDFVLEPYANIIRVNWRSVKACEALHIPTFSELARRLLTTAKASPVSTLACAEVV